MQFTKHGHTISFDIPAYDEALPNAREYAYFYGWRQSLQDAYANSKSASEMEGACQKKFDKIISGALKFRFDGQSARKSDLEREMESLAEIRVSAHAARKGVVLTKARLASFVEEYLARPSIAEELRLEAEETLAAKRAKHANVIEPDDFFAGM
jgi:hypothetical protein